MTVFEWAECWLSLRSSGLAPRTIESYRDLLSRYIAPALGPLPLAALTAENVHRLLASICAAGHARTAQLVYILLHAALTAAVSQGILARDPTLLIMRPRCVRADQRYWSSDELRIFVSACPRFRWGLAWLLALCCGLRRGELAGLRWQDVDIPSGVIHIRNQRQRLSGAGVIDCPPKSAAGRRDIPLPPALGRQLQQTLTQHSSSGVLPVYVITDTHNRPIDPHRLNLALACDIASLGLRPINVHGLRHTMATQAVSSGVSIKVLQTLLGHANYSTTADIYAHVEQKDQIHAIDIIASRVL